MKFQHIKCKILETFKTGAEDSFNSGTTMGQRKNSFNISISSIHPAYVHLLRCIMIFQRNRNNGRNVKEVCLRYMTTSM